MQIEAITRGEVHLMSTLTRWAERAGNSTPAMLEISGYMEERERALFQSEGASSGRPWQPLSDTTKETRSESADGGTGYKVLQRSGDLMRSLTLPDDPNAIRDIGPGFVRYGSKLGYAELHQRGFRGRSGSRTPARRPIDFTSRDRYVILKLLAKWITGRTRVDVRPGLRLI